MITAEVVTAAAHTEEEKEGDGGATFYPSGGKGEGD